MIEFLREVSGCIRDCGLNDETRRTGLAVNYALNRIEEEQKLKQKTVDPIPPLSPATIDLYSESSINKVIKRAILASTVIPKQQSMKIGLLLYLAKAKHSEYSPRLFSTQKEKNKATPNATPSDTSNQLTDVEATQEIMGCLI